MVVLKGKNLVIRFTNIYPNEKSYQTVVMMTSNKTFKLILRLSQLISRVV